MTEFNQIALGAQHTCVIRNGGEVWAWGNNSVGQLGNEKQSYSLSPVRVGDISNAVSVWAGMNNCFALTSTGYLYAWGGNSQGELGIGHRTEQYSPVMVPGVFGVSKVAAHNSGSHTLILLEDGTVLVAGNTLYTGARDGDSSKFGRPTAIDGLASFSGVKDIANGYLSSFLVNGDGTVWGVGSERHNALNNQDGAGVGFVDTWQRIGEATDVERVWGRFQGGVYKTTGGEYYGWGHDGYGQLGLGDTTLGRGLTHLPHYSEFDELQYGLHHGIALKNDGTVWSCGYNAQGQLGDGTFTERYKLTPVGVEGVEGEVTGLVVGCRSSSVSTATGVYAWGQNIAGQLGLGNTSDVRPHTPSTLRRR